MFKLRCLIFGCIIIFIQNAIGDLNFPKNFVFGVATAAYQIEGAWNESGKSESNWDHRTHFHPEQIKDHLNGDIACDSYHKLDEDLRLIRDLGVHSYRFSLSWARILPDGFSNRINQDGIRYYNELIDGLIAYNITPLVTIYHYEHPQALQELGGWSNPLMIDWFVDYARVAFELFGDRVKMWITFNEPHVFCEIYTKSEMSHGHVPYLCAYTVLKAHAKTYHMYKKEYFFRQHGEIGIVLDIEWYQPKTNTTEDIQAAIRAYEFDVGLFANPIFAKNGDYPTVVKERIAYMSALQNFSQSRLPQLTSREIKTIQGAADFLGVNYYTTYLVSESNSTSLESTYDTDVHVNLEGDPSWPGSETVWLKDFPIGIYNLLMFIKVQYDNPKVYITENGFSVIDMQDDARIHYSQGCLEYISKAIEDGCNIVSYYVWSLMDNFQWLSGYSEHFGLYHVNFSDPNRTRTPRASVSWYKNFIKSQKSKWQYIG
ncbi:myrosinase 1-like [Chrysoperla carnea]|uniref:myrosinase 1-like n=1 Tax=Chrysoperla carnea TaxID=189513 RepID=UPI001D065175|nr:myrosinase 1-like [Chrysoperla carnea]